MDVDPKISGFFVSKPQSEQRHVLIGLTEFLGQHVLERLPKSHRRGEVEK